MAATREFPASEGMNPFPHLSMQIAIREQFDTDRPAGVRALYQRLRARCSDAHALEQDGLPGRMPVAGPTRRHAARRAGSSRRSAPLGGSVSRRVKTAMACRHPRSFELREGGPIAVGVHQYRLRLG